VLAKVSHSLVHDTSTDVIIGHTPKGDVYGTILDKVTNTITQLAGQAELALDNAKHLFLHGRPADFTGEHVKQAAQQQLEGARQVAQDVVTHHPLSVAPAAGKATGAGLNFKTLMPSIPVTTPDGDTTFHSLTSLHLKTMHDMGVSGAVVSSAPHVDEALTREINRAVEAGVPKDFTTVVPNGHNGDLAPLLAGVNGHKEPVVHTYLDMLEPGEGPFVKNSLKATEEDPKALVVGGMPIGRAEQRLYGNFITEQTTTNGPSKVTGFEEKPKDPSHLPEITFAGLGAHVLGHDVIATAKSYFEQHPPHGDEGGLFKGLLPNVVKDFQAKNNPIDVLTQAFPEGQGPLDFGNNPANLLVALPKGQLTAPDLPASALPTWKPSDTTSAITMPLDGAAKAYLDTRGYNPDGAKHNLRTLT
jgi:hypothetical protein